ncbi:MAG: HipA domain-containing protein [Fulvivirga sp.]
MRLVNTPLRIEKIERTSGYTLKLQGKVDGLKLKHYRLIKDVTVGGDAPKELLRVYEFRPGKININKPNSWPIFIAKTGHKWYPYESITEHLLNRIGACLGLRMAKSQLYFINGQLRFLSKLFLNDKFQILEHGADLYSGYLGDKTFVDEVELRQMTRDFFTISFTHEALKNIYPHQSDEIFLDFIKMLVFDAIIGNNDRHFYNWGVLKHLGGNHQPIFSPIYDTARAFLWNRSEDQIKSIYNDHNRTESFLRKYIHRSRPKIGIEKKSDCNHLDIIRLLNQNRFNGTKDIVRGLINKATAKMCLELINDEFGDLLSKERLYLITKCLDLRFTLLEGELND